MKRISIYNSDINDNKRKREIFSNKLKMNGFQTSRNGEILIVIGGDGTFLSAIRKRMEQNPIFVGFNTGNLGFLSEFTMEQMDDFFNILKKEAYWIEEFPVYEIKIKDSDGEKKEFFVNDLVVERKSTRILHLGIHANDQKLCTVSGDGVIFSSQLGSTGYANAANGAILMDVQNSIEITPISPVYSSSYQSLATPLILNDNNEFTIFPNIKKQRAFRIVCDGKEIKAKNPKYIEVKKTEKTIRILRSNRFSRIDNIRHKILGES